MNSTPPRRSTSQLRFAAVALALEHYVRDMAATLAKRRVQARFHVEGWAHMPDSELEQIARYGRGHAEGAVREAHELGRQEGRAEMRAELGLAPEGQASPEADTVRLGPCPIDRRLCPVPASVRPPPPPPAKDPSDGR